MFRVVVQYADGTSLVSVFPDLETASEVVSTLQGVELLDIVSIRIYQIDEEE